MSPRNLSSEIIRPETKYQLMFQGRKSEVGNKTKSGLIFFVTDRMKLIITLSDQTSSDNADDNMQMITCK